MLADRLEMPLTLVHSVHPDVYLVGERRERALADGERLIDTLAADHRVDARVVDLGDPARLLTAVAADRGALVVVGRRAGRVKAALRGSVSDDVVRLAPHPVVVVPADARLAGLAGAGPVVAGVDESAGAAAAGRVATALADALGTSVDRVNVEPSMRAALYAPPARGPSGVRTVVGPTAAMLAVVAERAQAALLVVGTRGRGPLRSLVFGSVSRRLAKIAGVPVVVVREGAADELTAARTRRARAALAAHA
jgi:nucleotide-binding universal stress UspA family protein